MRPLPDRCALRPVCGVLVTDAAERVLLIQRRGDGTWSLPGGGVEPGESWRAAALRECREETGWEIEINGLFGIYSDPDTQVHLRPDGSAVHFVGVVFGGSPLRDTGGRDGEATALGFFAPDALPEPLFPPDRPVLQDWRAGVAAPVIG